MAAVTAQQVIDAMVSFAVGIANNNKHGYSQAQRSLYNYSSGTSYDCSSLVLTAIQYAFDKYGLTPTPKSLGCSYTGNMLNLTKCGFEIVATNQTGHASMKKGDIELNSTYHTAMAIDGNNIVHARSSEGTGNTTDDSGNEIRTQAWYNYSHGWTHRLRFTGKGMSLKSSSSSGSATTETKVTAYQIASAKSQSNSVKGQYKVTASTLNLRSTPGDLTSATVIAVIQKGESVYCYGGYYTEISGVKWLYVGYGTKQGYVCSTYLKKA